MSTPVCIANAVADALGAGEVLRLPLLPARLAPHVAFALAGGGKRNASAAERVDAK